MPTLGLDRRRLVRRHNPVLTELHATNALTVGNGDIAMTVDLTGLQSFPSLHELVPDPNRVPRADLDGLPEQPVRAFDRDDFQIPLRTQSTWGWYATRPLRDVDYADTVTHYETPRGPVPYPDRMGLLRAGDAIAEAFVPGAWFNFNPRRAHLGRLALVAPTGDAPFVADRIGEARTELDLWTGQISARYFVDGVAVSVTTLAHPTEPRFAVRVRSELLHRGWAVTWVFDDQPDDRAPFEAPLQQRTEWAPHATGRWSARRSVEADSYDVDIDTTGVLSVETEDSVRASIAPGASHLEVVVTLQPDDASTSLPGTTFLAAQLEAADWWQEHWEAGAAISFEGSSDPRAVDLERRTVLSQYLLAVNSAGATPPAETGLTYNTWSGKFHLEMHWWHAAHFPMWGRGRLLERSLEFYHGALESARSTARTQGYRGARWPKQTDLTARETPSSIGVFLIWQQPHIIYLLELLRLEGRDQAFIDRHYPLIEATAEFMADFVAERDGSFILPPPLIPAQESYLADRTTVTNPTFELAYWAWALRTANDWRERAGRPREARWDDVAANMAEPARLDDGTYAGIETSPYLIRKDHPSMLMALGWVPETGLVDAEVMAATLHSVREQWELQSSWGWDYPVMAMTAAHLGDLEFAFDALLWPSPKNQFLANGHNPQMPGFLTLYLPANGGLLAALAHIAAAAESGATLPDGWTFTAEGLDLVQQLHRSALAAR